MGFWCREDWKEALVWMGSLAEIAFGVYGLREGYEVFGQRWWVPIFIYLPSVGVGLWGVSVVWRVGNFRHDVGDILGDALDRRDSRIKNAADGNTASDLGVRREAGDE